MRKIASAFILAILSWFSGSALAFDACNPNSPAIPCTYDNRDFDTVMYNNNVKVFYQSATYTVDHTVNNDPDVNDVWKQAGPPCSQAVAWIYGTYYSGPCHVGVNTTAAGYGWAGTGLPANYFRYATSFTPSNEDGWTRFKQSYASLNNNSSAPHAAEDWNRGAECDDRGLPIYAIADGTVITVNDDAGNNSWGRTVLIQHDAPSGTYFLSGTGQMLTTIYSMYAHVLRSGQSGYNAGSDLDTTTQIYPSINKGDPVGQVGNANGYYVDACHLHLEILTSNPTYPTAGYPRANPYDWAILAYRTDASELIANSTYTSSSTNFSIYVHPYESSGSFKLNAATPDSAGTTTTSGNWTRYGTAFNPGGTQLGYSGIIFSKAANVSGTATWTPNLPKDGRYKVSVYVPQSSAGYSSATTASYTVSSNGNSNTPVPVNQSTNGGTWVDIGTYSLHKTGNPNVVLEGNTGESGKTVAVDAVRFQYVSSLP